MMRAWTTFHVAVLLAAVPALHAASTGGFALQTIGSITSDKAEIVSGTRSIKGSYSGTALYTPYLRTDPSKLPLQRNQTYTATFRYRILTAPNRGFEVLFYSPVAGAQNNFLPSQTITGAAGDTGSVTLTNTLGPFDDYEVRWNITGTGAIAIDDIRVANQSGVIVASEDAEPGTRLLSTFLVSTAKPVFVWGEPVKVTAAYYDETGAALPTGQVTWTVVPSTAASVAPDGTVTPKALSTFTVRGAAAGASGEVLMQAVPQRIVVTPEKSPMFVGSTQKMRADVLDVNGRPIPNTPVTWRVSSQYYDGTSSATVDSSGMLQGIMQARVRVIARVPYSGVLPGFDQVAQGDALVDIQAPKTYRFDRIFVARASGASTSTLAPRAAPLVPTEKGGFMFAASLDGLGSALLEWNDGNVTPLVSSGRVNLVDGFPLSDMVNYNRTASGSVLLQEADTSGSGLVSGGPTGLIAPIFARGSAVFGAQNTNTFDISRNSLADSGALLIRVGYNDAVTHVYTTGLFRGTNRGISEPVFNARDRRLMNGDASGWFDTWGIANDGTAWFHAGQTGSIWRSRPGQPVERLIGPGDKLGDATVSAYAANYSPLEELSFVTGNGDAVNAVYTDKGQRFLLWHDGDTTPSAILPANAYGIYWYDPDLGALLDAAPSGKSRGLYLWNSDGAKPLLLLNDTSLDGSPVQEVLSAANTSDGTVYVMVRTADNSMLIARLLPNPQVLLKAGDAVPVNVPPVISSLIPGGRKDIPLVIAGGSAGSIARLDESGAISPVVSVGTKLPDGKYFVGARLSEVRTLPDGRVVFGHDYFGQDSSLFTWNQGNIELTVRMPLKHPDGSGIGSPRNIEVNRQGDVAFHVGWNCCAVYRLRDGNLTTAVEGKGGITVDGIAMQYPSVGGIDDSGNVAFSGTNPDGSGFYLASWDGSASHITMSPATKMADGRQVPSAYNLRGCTDGFLVSLLGTVARYRNGTWDYLVDPAKPLATGAPANNLNSFDGSRSCDVVFLDGSGIGAYAGSRYHEIQDLQQLTPDGDLISVTQMLINDDGSVYVLGANDRGEEVIYRGTPVP